MSSQLYFVVMFFHPFLNLQSGPVIGYACPDFGFFKYLPYFLKRKLSEYAQLEYFFIGFFQPFFQTGFVWKFFIGFPQTGLSSAFIHKGIFGNGTEPCQFAGCTVAGMSGLKSLKEYFLCDLFCHVSIFCKSHHIGVYIHIVGMIELFNVHRAVHLPSSLPVFIG